MATTVKEIDPLDHLEERIQKAVALVHRLRDDNEAALKSAAEDRELFAMEKADAAKVADALRVDLEESKNTNARLNAEIASLREERQQVRARLEKLLAEARAAERMPWEPSQLSLYRLIFPQMTLWLPEEEGLQYRLALRRRDGAPSSPCLRTAVSY